MTSPATFVNNIYEEIRIFDGKSNNEDEQEDVKSHNVRNFTRICITMMTTKGNDLENGYGIRIIEQFTRRKFWWKPERWLFNTISNNGSHGNNDGLNDEDNDDDANGEELITRWKFQRTVQTLKSCAHGGNFKEQLDRCLKVRGKIATTWTTMITMVWTVVQVMKIMENDGSDNVNDAKEEWNLDNNTKNDVDCDGIHKII